MKKSMSICEVVGNVEAKILDGKAVEGFAQAISLLGGCQVSQLATAIAENERIIRTFFFILENWWMDMPLTLLCLELLNSVILNCEKSALERVTRGIFDRLAAILRETKREQESESMFQTVFNVVFNLVQIVSDQNVIGSVGADWHLFIDLYIVSGAPQRSKIATVLHHISKCDVPAEDAGFLDGLASILITDDVNPLVSAFSEQIERFSERGLQSAVPTSVTERCLTSMLLLDDARNCSALISAVRKLCAHEVHRTVLMEYDIDFNIILFNIYDEEVESGLTSLFDLVEKSPSPPAQAFKNRIIEAVKGISARKSRRLQALSRQVESGHAEPRRVAQVRTLTPEMEESFRRIYARHFEANMSSSGTL